MLFVLGSLFPSPSQLWTASNRSKTCWQRRTQKLQVHGCPRLKNLSSVCLQTKAHLAELQISTEEWLDSKGSGRKRPRPANTLPQRIFHVTIRLRSSQVHACPIPLH